MSQVPERSFRFDKSEYEQRHDRVVELLDADINYLSVLELDFVEVNEQRVAIAVCELTDMTLETWNSLDRASRKPWLRKTISAMVAETLIDDRGWPNQSPAAIDIGTNKVKIARLIKSGKLKTNGKSGRDCRVEPASILAYCKEVGIAYNEK